MNGQVWAIIPARYGSTRLEGKPLLLIDKHPMIQWVYNKAVKAYGADKVCVATDDDRIYKAVQQFGGRVYMTSTNHQSGTDRCAEALLKMETERNQSPDIVLNLQGDEPFISPDVLLNLTNALLNDHELSIATLVQPFRTQQDLEASSHVKVVVSNRNRALYFSRSVIPFIRNQAPKDWINTQAFFWHLGLYAYRRNVLLDLANLSPSPLEQLEGLEQLRWLEAGYSIGISKTDERSLSIDTPDDLRRANQLVTELNLSIE